MDCSSPPTTNPDLVPPDIDPFGALKDAICWIWFWSDAITEEVKKWLQVQNSKWYKKGTDCVPWNKAAEVDEDYIEKQDVYVLHPPSYLTSMFTGL
jgi:hypothetical protein